MQRSLWLLFMLIVMALSGCVAGTAVVYEVATISVDERKVGILFSDQGIDVEIKNAYFKDDVTNLRHISPHCFNGCVYLVGEYETEDEKEKAITIAKGVKGVKSVEPYLLPKANDSQCTRTHDHALAAKVKAKLINNKDTSAVKIHVKCVQCRVILLGIVGSQKEIDEAIADAKATEGVQEVVSYLQLSH